MLEKGFWVDKDLSISLCKELEQSTVPILPYLTVVFLKVLDSGLRSTADW